MPRSLIVNADDLGLCPSVNTGIFDVYRCGNLSSATLMVGMPGTEDALSRLKDFPGLGVGLHFNITEGAALTGRSSLTDAQGRFLSRSHLVSLALRRRFDRGAVRAELQAQLEAAGSVVLTHVDSHQHSMMLPWVFDAVAPMLAARRLPVRIVQPPAIANGFSLRRPTKLAKQLLNRVLASRNRRNHQGHTNSFLVSVHDLNAGPYDRATYRSMVEAAMARASEGVVEVMVHPFVLGEDLLAIYREDAHAKRPFLLRCEAEHRALTSECVFEDYRLITFAELADNTVPNMDRKP